MSDTESKNTERNTDKRLLNLRPAWGPGTSGNTLGRKKGSISITSAIKRVLREIIAEDPDGKHTRAEELARVIIDLAATGNTQALKELFSRVDGVLPTVLEGGDPTKPVMPVMVVADARKLLLERINRLVDLKKKEAEAALPRPEGRV